MNNYLDCEYSAFISYAHDDDVLLYDWISTFATELNIRVPVRVRDVRWRTVHLSGKKPVISGVLDDQLKARIDRSFAMFVIVHKNYPLSKHCQNELKYFASIFGDQALRDRLFIIALSKDAIDEVVASHTWKDIFSSMNPVWVKFYHEDNDREPLPISADDGKTRPQAFAKIFNLICDDLGNKINASVQKPPAAPAFSASQTIVAEKASTSQSASACQGKRSGALIYIESNIRERNEWEAIGDRIRKSWDALVADETPATRLTLWARGLPVDEIDRYPSLSDADGVVLLWGSKPPNALIAQIDKVEGKLSGRYPAPGIVAYLIPPQNHTGTKLPAWGWKVLRFNADPANAIDVDPDEADDLHSFLKRILKHSRERQVESSNPVSAEAARP